MSTIIAKVSEVTGKGQTKRLAVTSLRLVLFAIGVVVGFNLV